MRDQKNKKKLGLTYFLYALESFGIIGLEAVLAYMIEPLLYGVGLNDFTEGQMILHWILTYLLWIAGSILVLLQCKRETGFDLFVDIRKRPFMEKDLKVWQWLLIFFGTLISLYWSYVDWNGFKVFKEFVKRGPVLFTFQYIYYLIEVFLVLLIIIFGQLSFENCFQKKDFPFGGFLAGITWGLAHMGTRGTLYAGLSSALLGFLLGSVYVLTNRNVKLSYIILCIIFIL